MLSLMFFIWYFLLKAHRLFKQLEYFLVAENVFFSQLLFLQNHDTTLRQNSIDHLTSRNFCAGWYISISQRVPEWISFHLKYSCFPMHCHPGKFSMLLCKIPGGRYGEHVTSSTTRWSLKGSCNWHTSWTEMHDHVKLPNSDVYSSAYYLSIVAVSN